jgi:hypothetical protein
MLKQTTPAITLILVFTTILLSLSCQEEIPEGPDLVQVIEASLTSDRDEYPQPSNYGNRYRYSHISNFNQLTNANVRFQIKVTNTFDETVEGIDWTEIKLRLWSEQLPNFKKTLSFTYHKEETEWLILHPGDEHYIYTLDSLLWDQTDDSGSCILMMESFVPYSVRLDSVFNKRTRSYEYFCDTTFFAPADSVVAFETPIEIQAQTTVKIFKNYDAVQSNIHRFQIKYFFPPGMIDRRRCPIGMGG